MNIEMFILIVLRILGQIIVGLSTFYLFRYNNPIMFMIIWVSGFVVYDYAMKKWAEYMRR